MNDQHQLTPRQRKAIQSLLNGRTKFQTAAAIGVTPGTLSLRLPSSQHRQFRHQALKDATLYNDPTPDQRQMFLNILAELNK